MLNHRLKLAHIIAQGIHERAKMHNPHLATHLGHHILHLASIDLVHFFLCRYTPRGLALSLTLPLGLTLLSTVLDGTLLQSNQPITHRMEQMGFSEIGIVFTDEFDKDVDNVAEGAVDRCVGWETRRVVRIKRIIRNRSRS
jgi:hypothetical protein